MSEATRVAFVSTLASGALAVTKIAVGLSASSAAVVSDGIESAGDVLTSGLVFLAVRLAAKPADDDHPYGHGRVDILAGQAVGMVLVLAGVGICWRSLTHPVQVPALYAIWRLKLDLRESAVRRRFRTERAHLAQGNGSEPGRKFEG